MICRTAISIVTLTGELYDFTGRTSFIAVDDEGNNFAINCFSALFTALLPEMIRLYLIQKVS